MDRYEDPGKNDASENGKRSLNIEDFVNENVATVGVC
jgi:hypothetical protein